MFNRPLPAPARDIALLIGRVVLGVVLFAHGWQKLMIDGIAGTYGQFEKLGIPLAIVSASFASFVEFVGGVLLIAGALTTTVVALDMVVMVGAAGFVHITHGIFAQDGGWELVGVIVAAELALAATGPGRFSIDHLISSRRAREDAAQKRTQAPVHRAPTPNAGTFASVVRQSPSRAPQHVGVAAQFTRMAPHQAVGSSAYQQGSFQQPSFQDQPLPERSYPESSFQQLPQQAAPQTAPQSVSSPAPEPQAARTVERTGPQQARTGAYPAVATRVATSRPAAEAAHDEISRPEQAPAAPSQTGPSDAVASEVVRSEADAPTRTEQFALVPPVGQRTDAAAVADLVEPVARPEVAPTARPSAEVVAAPAEESARPADAHDTADARRPVDVAPLFEPRRPMEAQPSSDAQPYRSTQPAFTAPAAYGAPAGARPSSGAQPEAGPRPSYRPRPAFDGAQPEQRDNELPQRIRRAERVGFAATPFH
ncbi:DoxX family membrane protein [Pseudonocardia sp.]|uniref:DoxX family protein n=1 Tax=Pseudonocardia sp. TaxID=60912 RepID=UPI002639A1DD|nr:DoxX family membrane protein [Pseudonocardia sp.]MCW2720577.1 hypothetical protein [Pseudonocardia sp.]